MPPSLRSETFPELVRRIFDYCPETGILRWKPRSEMPLRWNSRCVGKIAGSRMTSGHLNVAITIDSVCKKYLVHHVIWAWMKGYVPTGLDHRDLDPGNNKWLNLREADKSQNGCNRLNQVNNRSGHKGVCWNKAKEKWKAYAKFKGKMHNIGHFDRIEDAIQARIETTRMLHGEFFREVA